MKATTRVALGCLSAFAFVSASACTKTIPAPDVNVTSDEAMVARGAYLANAMGCIACHSKRDWSRLGGPPIAGAELKGDAHTSTNDGFPPEFQFGSPNLTPAHLKDWSDGEIVRAVALGQRKDGAGLFPLMPYMEWRDSIALDDAAAVVAYLRSLPAAPSEAMPERKFPMPGFVLNGFPEPRTLRAQAPKPGDADFGAYVLVRSACFACHTAVDEKGKYIGAPYAGGRAFKVPAPGGGTVTAANLTPDKETGLGGWTKEQFIQRFKTQGLEVARATPVEPGGYNTLMPWWAYAQLTDEELGAIYEELAKLPPSKSAVLKWTK